MMNICKARFSGTAITLPWWWKRLAFEVNYNMAGLFCPLFIYLFPSCPCSRPHNCRLEDVAVATAMTAICSEAIKIPQMPRRNYYLPLLQNSVWSTSLIKRTGRLQFQSIKASGRINDTESDECDSCKISISMSSL